MSYKQEIQDLLTGFRDYKKKIKILQKAEKDSRQLEEKIDFLEFCISLLEVYQRELIYSVLIDGVSIRKYADHTGLSRNFIAKERQRIIDEFSKYFSIKFDS